MSVQSPSYPLYALHPQSVLSLAIRSSWRTCSFLPLQANDPSPCALSGINEWRSTLVRLRQFESELFPKSGGRGASAPSRPVGLVGAVNESRGLIRQRRMSELLEDAEMRPVAEWRDEVAGPAGAVGSDKRI